MMAGIDPNRPFTPLNIAVLTVSDSRTAATDRSGDTLVERLLAAGHHLADRALVVDDIDQITNKLEHWIANAAIDVVITTGGTGVTGRDLTPEAVERVAEKLIPGFGELFRLVSHRKIGTSALQSRATAGVARGTYIFALPGSPGACRDGWDEILSSQLDIRHRPCNFAELLPRLQER
jgi:molybdenum cofactor biosynthesis protein B